MDVETMLREFCDAVARRDGTAFAACFTEDATYHERLLAHVRAFQARPADAAPLLRDNVAGNPRFAQLERTFGELTGAMRYFSKLPRDLAGAVRHLVRVREFPAELAAG